MSRLLLAVLLFLPGECKAAGFKLRSTSFDATTSYDFVVEAGVPANRWESETKPLPLSPKKARAIALNFMKKIPTTQDGWEWFPWQTTLHQVSEDPEEWVYIITFDIRPKTTKQSAEGSGYGRIGPPDLKVVVQMDGKIPASKVDKAQEKEKDGP